MIRIAIVTGSTRLGRKSPGIARWAHEIASHRSDAEFEFVDIADFDLPLLDEPKPAAFGPDNYVNSHTIAWAEKIAGFDGYVFTAPEYNHSCSAALKNAIDYLYVEWANKAAGFVGYGTQGGIRAVEHLRHVMAELQIATVQSQVGLSIFDDFDDDGAPAPRPSNLKALDEMLGQVVEWSKALATLRISPSESGGI